MVREGRRPELTILADAPTFDAVFEEYVLSRTEDRPHDGRLHPSSLFFCDRKVIYDLRSTEREQTSGSKRPLLVGKVLHVEMQAALEAQVGRTIKQLFVEGRVDDPDTGIKGDFDALYQLMDDSWELWEGKSANANSFRLTKKSGEAKPDHALQGLSYIDVIRRRGFSITWESVALVPQRHHGLWMAAYKPPYTMTFAPIPDLTRLRVVYLDKDKHGIHEAIYNWSEQWRNDELKPHLDRLERYRAGEALPPRLPKDSWQCASDDGRGRWCPYFDRCWNVDPEGVDL